MKNLTTPLNNTDAEQSVLGGLILDNSAWEKVENLLQASDFYHKSHQCIFHKIMEMLHHNQPVDVITLTEALKKSGETDLVGGIGYLHALVQNTPSAANIQRYAKLVRDYKIRRNVIELSHQINTLAHENSPDNLLENITSLVMSAADNRSSGNEGLSIGQLLPGLLDTLDARLEKNGAVSGVSTGFTDLDHKTCGLQPGDLIIIAGRPSMGKTTLAVNMAENVATNGNVALIISLEMAAAQLVERSIARFGSIDTQVLRTGKLTQDDYPRLTFGLQKLQDQHLIIADDPALSSVAKIRLAARKTKQKQGKLDLIVIDYLQLMQGTGNTRNEEISGITRSLKLLAKELDCPIILLSQLSRDVEKRADKRPLLSDLRDSGSIEQDADVVLMAYRDDYYNSESAFKGYAELLIRKQRMGPLADIYLCFEGRYSRFSDADQRELARLRQATAVPMGRKNGF